MVDPLGQSTFVDRTISQHAVAWKDRFAAAGDALLSGNIQEAVCKSLIQTVIRILLASEIRYCLGWCPYFRHLRLHWARTR